MLPRLRHLFRHSSFGHYFVIRASSLAIFPDRISHFPEAVKHTPLYPAHQQLGAKLIEFGGWEMPVYYTSIMDEHQAVRTSAGLFDISHMGEFQARGKGAAEFTNSVLTNDIRKLTPGLGQYTLLCNEKG